MTSTAKHGRNYKAPAKGRVSSLSSVVLTILTVFVLVLGGLGVAKERAGRFAQAPPVPTQADEVAREVSRDLDSDLFFLATDALSRSPGSNLAPINIIFKDSVKDLLDKRYDTRKVGDYTATYKSFHLDIMIMPMSVVASGCAGNISVSGATGAFAAPAYYRLLGNVFFELSGPDDVVGTANITVDRLVPDISPFITARLAEMDANGKSEFSDVGRMVRYMLTTLVRFRASQGIGSGPYDTEKDLLNEGDVELVVNLAVLLEEARLFGTYDKSSVRAMDHYFLYATDPTEHQGEASWEPYNPTGLRPWGSAEIKNYARYQNRMPQGAERSLEALFDEYVSEGIVDPADLMALYLNLDRYVAGQAFDPSDQDTLLNQRFLFDGRYSPDRRDMDHLVYYSSVGPRDLILKDPSGTYTGDYRELLAVDQSPDHLTMGSSITVNKNITVPYKWMTNARLSEGSRTGGVPPPQPPPDHDWVMLWDFSISGSFAVAVGRDPASSQEDGTGRGMLVNRTISLDIPINIFAFLSIRPMNSAVTFTNLNVGSPPGATYNFTYESLAYEHFSNSTWPAFKDIYGAVLGETIRLVKSSTCPYPTAVAEGSDVTALDAGTVLRAVPDDVWASVDDFVQKRLTGPNLSTLILKPFMESTYLMDIDYIKGDGKPVAYTLRLAIESKVGNIVVDLRVIKNGLAVTGRASVDSHIVLKGLLDVELGETWDAALENIRPIGSGTMQGDWSLVWMVQGQTVNKGVAIDLGQGITLWLVQERGSGEPDRSDALLTAVPKPLGLDPAANLGAIALAMKAVDVGTLDLLISTDGSGWAGLRGSGSADVQLMLDWVSDHSRPLIGMVLAGRLDISAIGYAADDDLAGHAVYAMSLTNRTEAIVPLMYYMVSSQMFQLDRTYSPPKLYVLQAPDLNGPVMEPLSAKPLTIGYTLYSEAILNDPEVDYG